MTEQLPTEESPTEEPTPKRLAPILLVVATLAVTSWACATALERLDPDGVGTLAESGVAVPLGTPADRLDRR
jgi:hypothetical protein